MIGWIKVHRKLAANGLWADKPFARGQAWLDILLNTSYENSSFFVRGIRVDVQPGQCAMSQETMAKRWGWSRKKVANFLEMLKKAQQIEQQILPVTTLITIVNWCDHQVEEQQKAHQKHIRSTSEAHIKEVKEVKEETLMPEWLPSLAWNDFVDMRQRIKKPMTDRAKSMAVNKLTKMVAEGQDAEMVLNQSTMNNWTDLHPVKEKPKRQVNDPSILYGYV